MFFICNKLTIRNGHLNQMYNLTDSDVLKSSTSVENILNKIYKIIYKNSTKYFVKCLQKV